MTTDEKLEVARAALKEIHSLTFVDADTAPEWLVRRIAAAANRLSDDILTQLASPVTRPIIRDQWAREAAARGMDRAEYIKSQV